MGLMHNLDYFLQIKSAHRLEIIDSHVHPLDVFGVVDGWELTRAGGKRIPRPSLLESLEYSGLALRLLKLLFHAYPRLIRRHIRRAFIGATQDTLLHEMQEAGIDASVLISVEPFAKTQDIHRLYPSSRFLRVGSVNIHDLSVEEIELSIEQQIRTSQIVGIKLHPNLQRFFPQPSMNSPEMAAKLKTIYGCREETSLSCFSRRDLSCPRRKDHYYRRLRKARNLL